VRFRWITIAILAWVLPACELIDEPTGQFHARFDDAGGLREGAPVLVAGVRTGRVGIVKLDGDKARVDFTMDKGADVIVHEDACVLVQTYGVGEPHLKLRPGTSARPALAAGGEITCVESVGQRAEEAVKKATELLEGVANGKGTIGRLLRDEELADKVERFFEQGPHPSAAPTIPVSSASAAPPASTPVPKPPKPKTPTFKEEW